MTDASVVTVGTPQSFRQQVARVLEVEADDIGWVQSATAAEELLINAASLSPVDVLVLSPEVKEPDALGLAEFVGRTSPGTAIVLVRDHTWNGLLPAAMRAGIRDVVDMTQGNDELREAVERAIVWATNLRSAGAGRPLGPTARSVRGSIVSVFSSKGGSGKTFLTTNLATAIADVTQQDTAVVDLDVDMGDVFTYFGREPSATIHDLMQLGEGATGDADPRRVGVEVAPHTWAFGAPPDPAAEAPAGEAIGKFLRGDPQRVRLRRRGRVGRLLGLGARVLRPVRHDLPRDRPGRRRREAPREGARHAAHDRPAAGAVPRGPQPRGLEGRSGRVRRGAGHEDLGRRDDPVEPARPDVAEQGPPGRARRARLGGLAVDPAPREALRGRQPSPHGDEGLVMAAAAADGGGKKKRGGLFAKKS